MQKDPGADCIARRNPRGIGKNTGAAVAFQIRPGCLRSALNIARQRLRITTWTFLQAVLILPVNLKPGIAPGHHPPGAGMAHPQGGSRQTTPGFPSLPPR